MGWKNLKEKFGIGHLIQINEKGICIGSGYVHDLAVIDPTTGKIRENQTFSGFLNREYPALLAASSDEILELINTTDAFTASITVYTYDGGEIIEKQCEILGWPNSTHDGCMMYENTFSDNKEKVVKWAKRNIAYAIKNDRECIERVEKQLAELKAQLATDEVDQAKLETNYPNICTGEL